MNKETCAYKDCRNNWEIILSLIKNMTDKEISDNYHSSIWVETKYGNYCYFHWPLVKGYYDKKDILAKIILKDIIKNDTGRKS